MGLPILEEAFNLMRDFFKSHKYLQLTFLLLILLFASNIIATMIAGFNVACTSDGEVRELDSYFTGIKVISMKQSVNDDAECQNEEDGLLGNSVTGHISLLTPALWASNRTEYCDNVVTEEDFDNYLELHSEEYEFNETSFDLKDSLAFGCRGIDPTITFFRIDILDYRLWFIIFLLGELLLLEIYLERGRP